MMWTLKQEAHFYLQNTHESAAISFIVLVACVTEEQIFAVQAMGRRCEKNDLANFVRIFSNIYAVSQLFS